MIKKSYLAELKISYILGITSVSRGIWENLNLNFSRATRCANKSSLSLSRLTNENDFEKWWQMLFSSILYSVQFQINYFFFLRYFDKIFLNYKIYLTFTIIIIAIIFIFLTWIYRLTGSQKKNLCVGCYH